MLKIMGDLFFKLILSHFVKSEKESALRTVILILVVAMAMGLLQYSDAMLNVHKATAINKIEKPVEILKARLESCQAEIEHYKRDLNYCHLIIK